LYEYIDKMLAELPTDMNQMQDDKLPKSVQCKSCSKKIAQGNCPDISPSSSQATIPINCTRQDIQTAVVFKCTRVQAPNKDDFKNLTRVMQ